MSCDGLTGGTIVNHMVTLEGVADLVVCEDTLWGFVASMRHCEVCDWPHGTLPCGFHLPF